MTRSTSKRERLSDKNPAWYNERWEAFELYWNNQIDKQTFKQKIEEIDFKYKHPDEYRTRDIEKTQKLIEELKEEYETTGDLDKEKIEEMEALIEKYELLKKESRR